MAALTVGAYAASFQEAVTVMVLSGSDFELLASAASGPADIGWTLNSSGQVDEAKITCKPASTGNFIAKVQINTGGPEGFSDVSGTLDVQQVDTVSISPVIEAVNVSTVELVIAEQ